MKLHDHEILTMRMKTAAVCVGMCRVPCAIMCYPFQGDHHAEFLQHQQPVGHDARLHQSPGSPALTVKLCGSLCGSSAVFAEDSSQRQWLGKRHCDARVGLDVRSNLAQTQQFNALNPMKSESKFLARRHIKKYEKWS